MNAQVKRCPFCGALPVVVMRPPVYYGCYSVAVVCHSCMASAAPAGITDQDHAGQVTERSYAVGFRRAVESWNMRCHSL